MGLSTISTGADRGSSRVCRGGGRNIDAGCGRVSRRDGYSPDNRSHNLGLRLVLSE